MLQQTQVNTVLPYYSRWMERFPDVGSVAAASEEELLRHWEGLGYYARVRNIHTMAKILVEEFGGELPNDHRKVSDFPGIGPYTAGAIMSLAFGKDFPTVDGNVERLFSRLFNIKTPIKEKDAQVQVWKLARDLLPHGKARHFNQAMMDLGATVCLPRNPHCIECPLSNLCESCRLGVADQRPVRGAKKVVSPLEVAVGILLSDGKMIIQKRSPSGLMPHLWEFPGGKIQRGESPEKALVREFFEELELKICVLDKIATIRHNYTAFRVDLYAYYCRLEDDNQEPVLHGAVDFRWVTREELDQYAFPAANRKLIRLL